MARFDVHANLNPATQDRVPYLLDLQADLLAFLRTRLVAPLVPRARFGPPAARLNPVLRIGRRDYVMDTALIAGVPSSQLGEKIASMSQRSSDVLGALDLLVSGI